MQSLINLDTHVFDKFAFFKTINYVPHSGQEQLHRCTARYRIMCCGVRWGKSLSAAAETLAQLIGYPNQRVWVIAPCVDEKTEILTEHGWLDYSSLSVGDFVLTLNRNGNAEWQQCTKINTYPYIGRMVHISQRGHDSITTPHHRWLVGWTGSYDNGKKHDVKGYRFTTTDEMIKTNEFVLCGAKVINLPTKKTYSNAFVELVGWYVTEGTNQVYGNGVIITQNMGVNSDRIRDAAYNEYGPACDRKQMKNNYDGKAKWSNWKKISNMNACGRFGFNSVAGKRIRECAPDKVISMKFIKLLTQEQLELLLDVLVSADGHMRIRKTSNGTEHKERIIRQRRKDRIDRFQIIAQLSGFQSYLSYLKSSNMWNLQIYERNRIYLGQKKQLRNRTNVFYDGVVWCPTTPNGTWLARRNGTVYFTGNTYDLTEKVYREVRAFLINYWPDMILSLSDQPNTGMRQYITKPPDIRLINNSVLWCKTADNLISLSGEALDLVVMDECPGIKEEAWTHYIRERLTDRRGKALQIGTPKGKNWYYQQFLRGMDKHEQDYWSLQAPTWTNPYIHPDEIASAKKELPERAFRQEYGAEFISEAGGVFRHVRERIRPGGFTEPIKGTTYRMGVDLAKYQDYTVCCVVNPYNHVVYFERFPHCDWSLQKLKISEIAKKYNDADVIIDSTGVGDPIYEDLSKAPYSLRITPYHFGMRGAKQTLIDNLALRLENGEVTYPEITQLINELEIYEYETTSSGRLRFNAPAGYHDDCVIALALAVLQQSTKWYVAAI